MTTNVATTTTTRKEKLLTADDLLELHSKGIKGELIRGVLANTMSTGVNHGRTVVNITILLGNFVKPHRLGTLVASDTGILIDDVRHTVREPDIAFFSADNMPLGANIPGYSDVVPDLVVEVASPNDTVQSIYDKAHMWLYNGVRLVWVGHPDWREVEVYSADGSVFTLGENDTLDGGDVLPGFACKVSDIFDV